MKAPSRCSSKSKSKSSMMPSRQCRCSIRLPMSISMLIMMQLAVILSYLAVSHGFQNAATWSPSISVAVPGRAAAIQAPSSSSLRLRMHMNMNMNVNVNSEPSASASGSRGRIGQVTTQTQRSGRCSGFSCSNSKLFPQRKAYTSTSIMMTTDNTSGDDSDSSKQVSDGSKSPLVKVWLSFRKLLAKLWALFLKPFQLLKSLLGKTDKDNKDETTTNIDNEQPTIPEAVAITEVENIAALEEEEKSEEIVAVESASSVADSGEEEGTIAATDEVAEPVVEAEPAATDDTATTTDTTTTASTSTLPRQATPSNNVDLTGNWTLIVDEAFTSQYDEYLRKLGQPMLVRTVALTVIGSTKEEAIQTDEGRKLFIRGMNVRGSWERTLEASEQLVRDGEVGEDGREKHAVEGHELNPMTTADGEDVEVASWWEQNEVTLNGDGGAVHHSWVVGGKKYGGGDFENKRYLTDNGNILVCESTFHPMEEGREDAAVTWRFLREGAIYGDKALQMPNIFDVLKKEDKKSDSKKQSKALPVSPEVVVGDIMDSVAITSDETESNKAPMEKITNTADIANIDMLEEAIEQSSWVPPSGKRWAITAPGIDLTGKWKLIITEKFKKDYEEFLSSLGQPLIVRAAAVALIGNTREETKQADNGRSLYIKGINAKGIWERTLTSSGSDFDTTMHPDTVDGKYTNHVRVPIVTADSENVEAESWWENDGSVHVSWTYGVKMYGGGAFESKRYLENDGDVYVCESTFHPDNGKEKSYLKWKFLREGAAFMLDQDQ